MSDERKAPPEEDSKQPAGGGKRLRVDDGVAVSVLASGDDVFDVADQLRFQPGDRLEVKWTISDEDDSDAPGATATASPEEKTISTTVTLWWAATLASKTGKMHTLTDEERGEGASSLYQSSCVRVPIYNLNYAPMEDLGYDTHSLEEVAFISNKTLLNLSTDELMTFRRVGEKSPPPSPPPEADDERTWAATAASAQDDSSISRVCNQEEMSSFMDDLMQKCLESTGMDEKMKGMPASQQLTIAERIAKAKEGFLAKLIEETDKMESGNKVITQDVVRKVTAQMGDGGF